MTNCTLVIFLNASRFQIAADHIYSGHSFVTEFFEFSHLILKMLMLKIIILYNNVKKAMQSLFSCFGSLQISLIGEMKNRTVGVCATIKALYFFL